jgi:hypothetical protein
MWVQRVGLGVALTCAMTSDALAGARPYAFTQGVDSLPENDVELESWFTADTPRAGGSGWDWWLGPVVGITDQLEVGLFAIAQQLAPTADMAPPPFVLNSLRLQVTYLLAPKAEWPVDVRMRAELRQPIVAGEVYATWLSAIVAKDFAKLNVTANVGSYLEFDGGPGKYFQYGLGASYELLRGLRGGGELFGDGEYSDASHDHFIGPSVAFGRGRLWFAGTLGFGLDQASSKRRGRLVVGVAF